VGVPRHVGGIGISGLFSQKGQRIFDHFYSDGDVKVVDHSLGV